VRAQLAAKIGRRDDAATAAAQNNDLLSPIPTRHG
jgi:hypothetical protein